MKGPVGAGWTLPFWYFPGVDLDIGQSNGYRISFVNGSRHSAPLICLIESNGSRLA